MNKSPAKFRQRLKNMEKELNEDEMNVVGDLFNDMNEFMQISIVDISTDEKQVYALSQHFIAKFVKDDKTNQLQLESNINLLEVQEMSLNPDSLNIIAGDTNFTINSTDIVDFAKILYRNLSIIHFAHSQDQKPQVYSYDKSLLPPFNPPLSLAQIFQFFYSSFLCYANLDYAHHPVRYFHYLLSNSIPIFDCSRLPQFVSEHLPSALFSMMSFPNIKGVVCHDTPFQLIYIAILQMLSIAPKNLGLLHVNNCDADTSKFEDFCNVLGSQDFQSLEYIDISDNIIESIQPFTELIGSLSSPLVHLGLSNCNLNEETTSILIKSLNNNENMENIRELKIGGAVFNKQSLAEFNQFCSKISLSFIDISNTNFTDQLLSTLLTTKQPIKKLIMSNCKINEYCYSNLLKLIHSSPTINYLDISSCRFSGSRLGDIISAMGEHKDCTLILDELLVDDSAAVEIARGFISTQPGFIKKISLRRSNFNESHQKLITSIVKAFQLEEISIDNPSEDCQNFVIDLLNSGIKRLNAQNSISTYSMNVIDSLVTAKCNFVDLSYNNMNDEEINKIVTAIQTNHNLKSVKISGSVIEEKETFEKIVNLYKKYPKCTEMMFKGSDDFGFDNYSYFLEMSEACDQNRANNSMSFEISIDYNFDEFIKTSNSYLINQNIHKHSVIGDSLDLPYPFKDNIEKQKRSSNADIVYGLPCSQIDDGMDDEPSQFVYLQNKNIRFDKLVYNENDGPYYAVSPLVQENNKGEKKTFLYELETDDEGNYSTEKIEIKPIKHKLPAFDTSSDEDYNDEENMLHVPQFDDSSETHPPTAHRDDLIKAIKSDNDDDSDIDEFLNTNQLPDFTAEMFSHLINNPKPIKPISDDEIKLATRLTAIEEEEEEEIPEPIIEKVKKPSNSSEKKAKFSVSSSTKKSYRAYKSLDEEVNLSTGISDVPPAEDSANVSSGYKRPMIYERFSFLYDEVKQGNNSPPIKTNHNINESPKQQNQTSPIKPPMNRKSQIPQKSPNKKPTLIKNRIKPSGSRDKDVIAMALSSPILLSSDDE